MKPEAEDYLWHRVPPPGVSGLYCSVRAIIERMVREGMIKSPKQAWRTLEKWCDQGCYEYGTTIDLGWRTDKPRRLRK